MKIAIMQPYLFPYIGYFQLINAVDKFVLLDDVNFITRGWINRNRILVNGKEHLFTVPVKKASQNKLISECELSETDWKGKLIKTIELAYKKSPYFKECYDLVSSILSYEEINLSKWLANQLILICNYLEIETIIVDTSRIYCNSHLKAQNKILDICTKENADEYYNAIGGKTLYNKVDFAEHNISLNFLSTISEKYLQNQNEFVPFLSIIDIMMFNSKSEIKLLLKKYEIL